MSSEMKNMISVFEAHKIIKKNMIPCTTENESIDKLSNRVLSENVKAPFDTPSFNNSAMDGFALKAIDTLGAGADTPVELKDIGVIPAGYSGKMKIGSGESAQCMTGAAIPVGADAVVPVEKTSGFNNLGKVKIFIETKVDRHIRFKGEETQQGELLIRKNTKISPTELGILATFGYHKINVYRQPRVAIFATGNELVDPGQNLKDGQIYNSNFYVLSNLVQRAGAKILLKQVVKDNPEDLMEFMGSALKNCDLIISSGGVSMGRFDYVREVLQSLKVKEHFWRVAQKPGKPLFFGTRKKTMLFGLPGNPVSAFIGFMEYIWPVLSNLSGAESEQSFDSYLSTSFPREAQKHRFLFGKVWFDNGRWLCRPSLKTGSHMLTSALNANCILSVPPGPEPLIQGTLVSTKFLPWMK